MHIPEAIVEINSQTDMLKLYEVNQDGRVAEETAEEIEAEHKERLSPLAFSKCNIRSGEVIEWYNDPAMTFVVLDDKNVENKGRPYSLSALASLLTSDKECGGAEVF